MIFQGLKLTILGDGGGVLFSGAADASHLYFLKTAGPVYGKGTDSGMVKKPARTGKKSSSSGDNLKLTAIISAAVAAHRARTRR